MRNPAPIRLYRDCKHRRKQQQHATQTDVSSLASTINDVSIPVTSAKIPNRRDEPSNIDNFTLVDEPTHPSACRQFGVCVFGAFDTRRRWGDCLFDFSSDNHASESQARTGSDDAIIYGKAHGKPGLVGRRERSCTTSCVSLRDSKTQKMFVYQWLRMTAINGWVLCSPWTYGNNIP